MFSHFFRSGGTRVFYYMHTLCRLTFSFKLDLWIICDVDTTPDFFIMFSFLFILVKRAKEVVMNLMSALMNLISPLVYITYVEGRTYGYVTC